MSESPGAIPRMRRRQIRGALGVGGDTLDTWHREGKLCPFPTLSTVSLESIEEDVVSGLAPPEPFIAKDSSVASFGSCFSQHVVTHLRDHGYAINEGETKRLHSFVISTNMVNTFTLRQQFEWVYEGRYPENVWYVKLAEAEEVTSVAFADGSKAYRARQRQMTLLEDDEDVRRETRKIFDSIDVFVFTLGLSEIWYNRVNGGVFVGAVPESVYVVGNHGFRVSRVSENVANLEAMYALIREHNPSARIIVAVSPVPLLFTFRKIAPVPANEASKAVVRAAADEFVEGKENVYYWPSYEIVRYWYMLGKNPYARDNRHVRKEVVKLIMTLFDKHYLTGS